MKNILIFLGLILVFGFVSCDKGGEPEIGGVAIQEMCGEWYVELLAPNAEGELVDVYGIGYKLISTYNTSSNSTSEMWIDDLKNVWEFKAKTPISFDGQTFSGTDLESTYYPLTITIANGKITEGTAETSGGNTTDGISFDIVFSDDAATTYTMKGYRRTGFLEDEH